jgi:DNA-binding CsgD family transcriptional regulator
MMNAAGGAPVESLERRRRLVAGLCRILGEQLKSNAASAADDGVAPGASGSAVPFVSLSPRMRQTLERLLVGDSEKEIAARLGLSPHTVHVYVKTLYRRFNVSSRGELFAVVTGRRDYIAR